MRKLAIFFLLLIFVITSSNNSMQMFSIEQGQVYTENYNLNHILNSLSSDICKPYGRHNDSLTPTLNYNHSHIILFNAIANSENDIIINPINLIPIDFTFSAQPHLHSLTPVNISQNNSILKFLSSILPPPLLKTTVLLI